MRLGRSAHGLERVEWRFVGQAFSPHRHDSYAIGLTLEGVQTFRYRGARRICLPGECHVLHPDELHDGGSGSAAPFAYRIAYVDPTLVQAQLGGSPLPFVTDPVVRLTDAQRRHLSPVWDLDDVLDEMALAEVGAAIADFLLETSDARAAIQGGLRHQSIPLPHDATARSRAARDPSALLTCRGIARCRILRPEPHDAHVFPRLRSAARTMGRSRRGGAMTGRRPIRSLSAGIDGRENHGRRTRNAIHRT
jgi:hypothetical protein